MSYSRRNSRKGIYVGPTQGLSSPKNSRRGCLCQDGNTYSTDCCEGDLINQGIGKIESTIINPGQFSSGFSDGFDIKIIR